MKHTKKTKKATTAKIFSVDPDRKISILNRKFRKRLRNILPFRFGEGAACGPSSRDAGTLRYDSSILLWAEMKKFEQRV